MRWVERRECQGNKSDVRGVPTWSGDVEDSDRVDFGVAIDPVILDLEDAAGSSLFVTINDDCECAAFLEGRESVFLAVREDCFEPTFHRGEQFNG